MTWAMETSPQLVGITAHGDSPCPVLHSLPLAYADYDQQRLSHGYKHQHQYEKGCEGPDSILGHFM
jgi:hypothetical protein